MSPATLLTALALVRYPAVIVGAVAIFGFSSQSALSLIASHVDEFSQPISANKTFSVPAPVQLADLSATAPFRYAIVLFSLLSGVLVFNEIPDIWAFAGMALIVGSAFTPSTAKRGSGITPERNRRSHFLRTDPFGQAVQVMIEMVFPERRLE